MAHHKRLGARARTGQCPGKPDHAYPAVVGRAVVMFVEVVVAAAMHVQIYLAVSGPKVNHGGVVPDHPRVPARVVAVLWQTRVHEPAVVLWVVLVALVVAMAAVFPILLVLWARSNMRMVDLAGVALHVRANRMQPHFRGIVLLQLHASLSPHRRCGRVYRS